jgi:hypothetical protein
MRTVDRSNQSDVNDPEPTLAELKSRGATVSCRIEVCYLSVGSMGGLGQ